MFELMYYFTLNLIIIVPMYFIVKKELVVDYILIIYLLSLWGFLVIGIPFAENIPKFNNYSFSYSIKYFLIICLLLIPVYLILFFKKNNACYRDNKEISFKNTKILFYILWIIAFFGIFNYVFYYGLPPLFLSLDSIGNSTNMYDLRITNTYSTQYREFKDYFLLVPLVASIIGHGLFLKNQIKIGHNILSISVAILLSIMFLFKKPIVFLLISLFFISILIDLKYKKYMKFIVILVMCSFLSFYYLYNTEASLVQQLERIIERITVPYLVSLDFSLNNFPSKYDFFYGITFPNPKGVFDFEPLYLSNFMMQAIAGDDIGTIPVPAVGVMYVNFGYMGILLYIFILTIYLIVLYKIYEKSNNLATLSLWSLLTLNIYKFNINDPFSSIDYKLIILVVIFYLLSAKYNIKEYNAK